MTLAAGTSKILSKVFFVAADAAERYEALLSKCNEITSGQMSVVTHTSKISELKTGQV